MFGSLVTYTFEGTGNIERIELIIHLSSSRSFQILGKLKNGILLYYHRYDATATTVCRIFLNLVITVWVSHSLLPQQYGTGNFLTHLQQQMGDSFLVIVQLAVQMIICWISVCTRFHQA